MTSVRLRTVGGALAQIVAGARFVLTLVFPVRVARLWGST